MKFGIKKKDGVSNVVASIMVLGIMTSLLGMIFTTYVPAMAESIQYEHQTQITADFVNFKNQIDTQIVRNDLEVSMSTTMTLGDQGGPVMSVGQNTGRLNFYPEDTPSSMYNATNVNDNYTRGRGSVIFATNYDRIADKIFYFEHDAVIMEQEGKAVMKVAPNIFLKNDSGNIRMSYTTIQFSGDAKSIGGTKTVPVTSMLISTQKNTYYHGGNNGIDDVELNLTTEFVDVWNLYLYKLLKDSDIGSDDSLVKTGDGWISLVLYDVQRLTTTAAIIDVEISD